MTYYYNMVIYRHKEKEEKNMKKITYTEYLEKIKNANEQIMQKYGNRRISIQTIKMAYESLELGVNWAGIGTATEEETRLFINQLNEVTAMVKSLNEEFKDCEVDFNL